MPMPGETAADTRVNASPTDAFAVWSKSTQKAAAYRLIDYMATWARRVATPRSTGAMSPYQAATGKRILHELRGLSTFSRRNAKVFPLMNLSWPNPAVVDASAMSRACSPGRRPSRPDAAGLDAAWGT